MFTGYHSPDGVTWTQQGSEIINMAQDAFIGFCVTAHASNALCTGVFDSMSFGSQAGNRLRNEMLGANASLWTRIEFEADETEFFDSMLLQLRYEDGFVAWLNGVEVARDNFAGDPQWNSAAGGDRADGLFGVPVAFDLSSHADLLREGRNIFAIQGLNDDKAMRRSSLRRNSPPAGRCRSRSISPRRLRAGRTSPGPSTSSQAHGSVMNAASTRRPFTLTLSCDTPGAAIRYTTDGSPPTEASGQTYGMPIVVRTTQCIRAAAFKPGWMSSEIDTHTYVMVDQVASQPAKPFGFPATWGSVNADYEMDPDVVNNAQYRTQMKASLMSLPTLSIVTNVDHLFGAQGILREPMGPGGRMGAARVRRVDQYRRNDGLSGRRGLARLRRRFPRVQPDPQEVVPPAVQAGLWPDEAGLPPVRGPGCDHELRPDHSAGRGQRRLERLGPGQHAVHHR